jgi:CHAT domain-containing protein
LEIRKKTLGANHPNVAASYYEIGNLYGTISNYHSSLEYIQEGNRILENNSQVANDVLSTYIAYAGKMYGLTGEQVKAKAAIEKAIAMAEAKLSATHPYRAVVYNIAGEYYSDTGDLEKQSEVFNKALKVYRASYGNGSEREGDIIAKMAATHAKLGRTDDALSMYKDALAIYISKLGYQNPKTSSVYLAIGDLRAGQGKVAEADALYEQALLSTDTVNKPMMLKIIRSKAKILDAASALAAYDRALQLTDDIAQGYNNEAARIQLEKEKRETCSAAIDLAWAMYDKSRDRRMIDHAFMFAEKSKAALLLENTKDLRAKTMAGVPDSLIGKERDLRIELTYYKNNLYNARRSNDTSAIAAFEKAIFDSERRLEAFKTQLERSFPSYFNLKYANKHLSLASVQNTLAKNTTLLQYFVTGNDVYCFIISHNSAELKKRQLDGNFKKTIENYQRSLTDLSFIMNEQRRADSLYQSTARELYSLLMIPETTQKLIVIPDDFLAQLNFGTILCDDNIDRDYARLPYLAHRNTISYAYSSAFLGESTRNVINTFAGFAPSYDQTDYTNVDSGLHPMAALVVRSGNLPLPGATEEVSAISKLMQGKSWINEDATETNFKKHSGDYDVLHLAMHSLLNDDDPRYSELLFNHRRDSANDGYLTIAEIYNLKLNAQMVVLSACSSGFGKVQRGEGPISLSRAFSYAGCPSVVMSLWKVPDLVTTSIMKNFYESLSSGLTKDEALQAAQVRFLKENTDPIYAHPSYWAGFVVIGDTNPLAKGNVWNYYLVGVGIVLVTGVIVWRFRGRMIS